MDQQHNAPCICLELKRLKEEQEKLSLKGFRYVCESMGFDTIPFILSNGENPFKGFGRTVNGQFFTTIVFGLEKLDINHCCATLSLLVPVDIDGIPIEFCDEVYSLLRTNICVTVDLNCFCSIQPLSPKLVNRQPPIVEPK